MGDRRKVIILSGINLYEGGPLSIYYDCLNSILELGLDKRYLIVAFVSKKKLFEEYENSIQIVELPKSRKNYLYRCFYEYIYFYMYSKKQDIYIWFSLHDMTPLVRSQKVYTYCHNASPFMEKDLRRKYGMKNALISFLYKYVYRINIKRATGIIVQQNWIRERFMEMYSIKHIIVAHPDIKVNYVFKCGLKQFNSDKKTFLYVSYPRAFKNFEIICEACRITKNNNYDIILTLDGSENGYAERLIEDYADISNIKWIGLQSREAIFELYDKVDCLIFPSRLESWGLPISEFKLTGKPMILADLPYAHETLGEYNRVVFFDVGDAIALSHIIDSFCENSLRFSSAKNMEYDYVNGWNELIKKILR